MVLIRYSLLFFVVILVVQAAIRKKECKCKRANNFINCSRKAPVDDICWYCENEHNCGYKAVELHIYASENLTNSKHAIEQCCPKIETLILIDSRKCDGFCSENWITKTSFGKSCDCALMARTATPETGFVEALKTTLIFAHNISNSAAAAKDAPEKVASSVLQVSMILFPLLGLIWIALFINRCKKNRGTEIHIGQTENVRRDVNETDEDTSMIEDAGEYNSEGGIDFHLLYSKNNS